MLEAFFGGFDPVQIIGLAFCAFLIGINKTGVPGIGTLPVVILTLLFPAKFSTGLQLILLCSGDLLAMLYHRRNADWKLLVKLLPCALAGIGLGTLTMHMVDDRALSVMIGIILILLSAVHFLRTYCWKSENIPSHWSVAALTGMIAGYATQIANAAGPVMAMYFLAMRLDKKNYMGTCAMYFLILNWIKLPVFVTEGRIMMRSVLLDLPMLPVMVLGGLAGIWFFRKVSQKVFEAVIQVITALSAVWLVISNLH